MRRLLAPALVLTLLAATGDGAPHAERVSATSSLAGRCTPNDRTLLYGESEGLEEEVAIAVDPRDGDRMAIAWTADMGLGIVVASSSDGGRSWHQAAVPGLGACLGGEHDRVIHPRPSFGPDGALYLLTSPLDGYWPDPRSAVASMAVSVSHDGGRTWGEPTTVNGGAQPAFNDLGGIAAEPDVPGAAIVAWSHPEVVLDAALVSRTTDHGRTWKTTAVRTPTPASLVGKTVVAHPDGTLLLFVSDRPVEDFFGVTLRRHPISVLRSTDKGATWSDPVEVTADSDALFWPIAAVAPDGPTSLVWASSTGDGRLQLHVRTSSDAGATWGPVRDVTVIDADQQPAVVAGPRGLIGLAYYRSTDAGRTVVLARSHDAGVRWDERELVAPFDEQALEHPVFGHAPIGYHAGLGVDGQRLRTAFVTTGDLAADGPTDVWIVTSGARR